MLNAIVLNAIVLNAIVLNAIMLSVVMLNVVAPSQALHAMVGSWPYPPTLACKSLPRTNTG
jgi:hypothetical protein